MPSEVRNFDTTSITGETVFITSGLTPNFMGKTLLLGGNLRFLLSLARFYRAGPALVRPEGSKGVPDDQRKG